eukprot:COSAG01_NODE_476_length_16515_cov_37.730690_6_plen_205_part_00
MAGLLRDPRAGTERNAAQPLLWTLRQCANVGADANRACLLLAVARSVQEIHADESLPDSATADGGHGGGRSRRGGGKDGKDGVAVHLYSALVNVAAKQRGGANFALAAQLVEQMRAEGIRPNEVTHLLSRRGCSLPSSASGFDPHRASTGDAQHADRRARALAAARGQRRRGDATHRPGATEGHEGAGRGTTHRPVSGARAPPN